VYGRSTAAPQAPKALRSKHDIALDERQALLKLSYTFTGTMKFEDYEPILYSQFDGSWVAEIPAIPGCYALMETREAALAELPNVFAMISEE
jgi:hypothetical protein